MKTIAKKSLSLVLAVLMALSTLVAGGVSAFADTVYTPYTGTVTVKDAKTYDYSYTAAKTGYYTFALSVSELAADKGTAGAYIAVKTYDAEDDYYDTEDSRSTDYEYVYSVANGALSRKKAYVPALITLKLTGGEKYYVSFDVDSNTAATLDIAATDYSYRLVSVYSDLTYKDGDDTYTDEFRTGFAAKIVGYYGSSAAVTIPAAMAGYPVNEVDLYQTPYTVAKRITSVAIPEGVEYIGGMAGFYALSSVNFPSTLKEIYAGAFSGCHALTGAVTIPATVESVGSDAFYDTGITRVNVLGNKTSIGSYAFGYTEVLNTATADPRDTTTAPVAGFMVVAPKSSLAAQYAANNGFVTYDPADCTAGNHPYAVTATKAATLFSKGTKTSTCPVCGAVKTTSIAKKTFKIKSAKSAKKGQVTVKAAKQSGIKGYQVQVSTSKKFTKKTTKTVKVATKKALSKTITGLKSGKKYYVRVRAYKTSGKKTVYSKYTKVKTVKVK